MLDSTPEEIRQTYGCLINVGRFFILTTIVGIVLSIWKWFDGRIVALTVLSLLSFIVTATSHQITDEYKKSLRLRQIFKSSGR